MTAEFKIVTVLFADVVRSMDLAAAVGHERLRDSMAAVLGAAADAVRRCGGTVDKFTGDGIMAVFGAPAALEDHALRACIAALDIQGEARRLSSVVASRDGVGLKLRIGLNSGRVIAGDMESTPFGYTTIGLAVGMAQRMESVAPPEGVMLSESTARLVGHAVQLGDPEPLLIKGFDEPVVGRLLLRIGATRARRAGLTPLVGRRAERDAFEPPPRCRARRSGISGDCERLGGYRQESVGA